ncbi:hypothetical protein LK09_10215 [Microbacterium mangrovi]|uniref:ABC3 transporter permease C-terminal domain-containing protein n=1 Tax=Microbacterium mangrovi TaxID=1348253 RepID=A0A0B2A8J2_9MICO|nr:FtsX-like permease family protein [Microbacterium mangrovi]KHK97837.1 hypothetical protein LK09_10215 [Microbacterium mangrovi]
MPTSPWTARARRRAALLWAIAAGVFVLALLLSLAAGMVGRAVQDQVRQSFADAAPAQRTLTLSTSARGLTGADRDAAEHAIAKAFGDAPVHVTRTAGGGEVTWTVAPDTARLVPADLHDLQHGFDSIGDTLSTVLAGVGGVTAIGTPGATTATVRAAEQTATETAVLPLGIIAVAGILAVGMLARLLVAGRAAEDRLLRSRGASSGLLVGHAAIEAALVALPAAVLGAAAAQLALQVWIGAPASLAEVIGPGLVALVGAIAAVVAVTVPAVTRPLGDVGPARRASTVLAGVVLLLLALAAVCAWRFANAADAAQVAADPLARIAPAVVLVALAAVVALLFVPVAGIGELPVRRRRGLPPSLAARLTARGAGLLAAPALLLALAVAVGTVAAGAGATSAAFLTDTARVVNGGAVRMTYTGDSMVNNAADLLPASVREDAVRTDAVASPPRTAPVLRTSASLSGVQVDVLGVPSAHLPALVPVAPAMFDADAARAALHAAPLPGPVLQGARVQATVSARTDSGAATASLTLWLVDPVGDVAPVGLAPVAGGQPSTVSAALPAGGPWTAAAIDVTVQASGAVWGATVSLTRLTVDGRDVPLGDHWTAETDVFGTPVAQKTVSSVTTTFASIPAGVAGGTQVRLMPSGSTTVPVIISDAFAGQTGLSTGASSALEGQVASFQARVVQSVPLIPGTTGEPALLADLPTLVRGQLAQSPQVPTVGEMWSFQPLSAAQVARYADGRQVTVQLPSTAIERAFVDLLSASLWLGAIGAALFAVLGVAATVAALQRRRRPEVDVLRRLGVTARTQARVRIVEPGAVVLYSLIAGVVAGLVAAVLIVPAVARTSAPSAPGMLPVVPAFAWAGFAALAVALVVGCGILLAVQHRATLRAARGGGPR